jgi:S1-C subfamily serine protease
MKTLGKMLLCIVTAILPGCTLQYPIVGIAKNYNEVFRGTVTANPWTGHGFIDVQALVTKVRCAGSARVTYAPATGSVSGQMGVGVLNCEDGRVVQASYTITGLPDGFGTGRDQFGNEFTFSFGMSEDQAAATTNNYLTTASAKPPLPTTQPKTTQPEKSVKQENPSQTAETKDRTPPRVSKEQLAVFGTGFFVNSGGIAITNAHVVESCKGSLFSTVEGEDSPIIVTASDSGNDLAALKLTSRSETYAQFRVGPPVRQGEQVVIYGYPLSGALANQGNLSTGIVNALAGLFNDTRELQISAPVQPGNSGGPGLDGSGNVIGIVTSKLNAIKAARITGDIPQNVNFAIKASIVANFLDANGIKYETTTAQRGDLTTADIGDRAKKFTFGIACQR